jgi:hemerythrin superfamily protein
MATDAVTAIMQDHRLMESLFEDCRTNKAARPALVAEIKARLKAHSTAEEERVYPTLVRTTGEEDDGHLVEEHREAEDLLTRLAATDPDSPEFDTALQEFVTAVAHHVEEEETDLLPTLEESVDRSTLEELGAAFEQRRAELLTAAGLDATVGVGGQAPAGGSDMPEADMTKAELYEQAKEAGVPGRSQMSKDELSRALRE